MIRQLTREETKQRLVQDFGIDPERLAGDAWDLERGDFSGRNLEGFCLNGAKLNEAKLNEAKLNGAKLNGAKLNEAELNWAELNWAELNEAKLNWAELNWAELNEAKLNGAELNGAELNWAELNGAKLNGAKLNGAELNGAKLNGAKLNGAALPENKFPFGGYEKSLMQTIVAQIQQDKSHLNMDTWHTCETVHCLAGWITTLHPAGKQLETLVGTNTAACLLIPDPDITRWFLQPSSDEEVLAWMNERWPSEKLQAYIGFALEVES